MLKNSNWNKADVLFVTRIYSVWEVLAMCTTIMAVVGLTLCFYRRHAKRQMREEINTKIEEAVSSYMAISNSDSEAKDRANRAQSMTELTS